MLIGSASQRVFGFEGDGLCTFVFVGSGYCQSAPTPPTGYEGPYTSFSNISGDKKRGTVTFTEPGGGLAAADGTYFSLEGAITPTSLITGAATSLVFTATSATSSDFADSATVAATLTSAGVAVPNAPLTFTLAPGPGSVSCVGTTNLSGLAACSLTPAELAGHIAARGVTICSTAPTAYRAMLAAGRAGQLRGLRRPVSAGEHLSAAVWQSSDAGVADVDFRGEVFGLSHGVTQVTASAGPISASVTVTVVTSGGPPGGRRPSSPAQPLRSVSGSPSPSPTSSPSVSPSATAPATPTPTASPSDSASTGPAVLESWRLAGCGPACPDVVVLAAGLVATAVDQL